MAATNFMIAMTGAMLVYGQVRASVISAIACRTLASAILPEFLTFITRAQPRWCSCERVRDFRTRCWHECQHGTLESVRHIGSHNLG